jgi:hypothetical protein
VYACVHGKWATVGEFPDVWFEVDPIV